MEGVDGVRSKVANPDFNAPIMKLGTKTEEIEDVFARNNDEDLTAQELKERQAQRLTSIDDDDGTTEYDVTEHHDILRHGIPDQFAQKPGPVFIDPKYGDSEEDEIVEYAEDDEPEGAEGGDTQTTRVTMKKEIHTKTVLKDGEEQTFVHEDSQVEQDPDTPAELRDSMQQIIDEFMGSPTSAQKPLEHDF